MNILYCGDKPMQKGILLSSMSLIKNVDEPLNIYILTVDYREKGINYKPVDKAFAKYLKEKLNKSDINDDFTLYIYSIKDGSYYYVDSSNISDMNLISEIRKELDNPFDKTFDTDKVVLSVSYYDEDTYNNVKYYMQLSDYSTLKSLGY